MNENKLIEILEEHLRKDKVFNCLSENEQFKIFQVYSTILQAVYRTVVYPNVTPLLLAKDMPSAEVLQKTINALTKIIPEVERIEIVIVN